MKNIIVCDPDIMMGKPVIGGTRITVELILEKLADGESYDELITAPPATDTQIYRRSHQVCRRKCLLMNW